MKQKYVFKAISDLNKVKGSLICNIIEGFPEDYEEQIAYTYGKLRTLFGEPVYETCNCEDEYAYCIAATVDNGDTLYLLAYSGASGPAIIGEQDEASKNASIELVKYIKAAEASDFEWKGYYLDGPTKLAYGIKTGVPFYDEVELDESEFADACRAIMGNGDIL